MDAVRVMSTDTGLASTTLADGSILFEQGCMSFTSYQSDGSVLAGIRAATL